MFKSGQQPIIAALTSFTCFAFGSGWSKFASAPDSAPPHPAAVSNISYLRLEARVVAAGTAMVGLLVGVKIHASVIAGARQKASPTSRQSAPSLDIVARLPWEKPNGAAGGSLLNGRGMHRTQRGREKRGR